MVVVDVAVTSGGGFLSNIRVEISPPNTVNSSI